MNTKRKPLPRLYTVAEVAEAAHVSGGTVRRWIRDGRLKARRVGPSAVRITRAEVDRITGTSIHKKEK